MIAATELRIGNWVSHISFGDVQVHGLNKECIQTEYKNDIYYDDISFHKPIPLTEEWLFKFGAVKYEFDHKENQYRLKDRLIVVRDSFFHDYGTSVKLEYVHRLQNLFFELGEELIITPNNLQ